MVKQLREQPCGFGETGVGSSSGVGATLGWSGAGRGGAGWGGAGQDRVGRCSADSSLRKKSPLYPLESERARFLTLKHKVRLKVSNIFRQQGQRCAWCARTFRSVCCTLYFWIAAGCTDRIWSIVLELSPTLHPTVTHKFSGKRRITLLNFPTVNHARESVQTIASTFRCLM